MRYFLQKDVPLEERKNVGLEAVFRSVFPIKDSHDTTSLEFVKYEMGDPKYSEEECIVRGLTFASPMKVTIRLVVLNIDANHQDERDKGRKGTGCLFR